MFTTASAMLLTCVRAGSACRATVTAGTHRLVVCAASSSSISSSTATRFMSTTPQADGGQASLGGGARRFQDTVAIVTGAGRDIGAATARRLGAEGAKVVVHYSSSSEGAQAVVDDIVAAGSIAVPVQADLTTEEGIQEVVKASQSMGPEVHTLVHNSGGLLARRPLVDLDLEFMNHVMALNFTSMVLLSQAVAPLMPAGGAIVTLSSQAAKDGGGPGAGIYAASKAAVQTYTLSLAKEMGSQGVRVNTVRPGMIDTGFHDTFTAPQVRAAVAGSTQLGREGTSEEVASVVAFLASADAGYMTGVAVDINGGLVFNN